MEHPRPGKTVYEQVPYDFGHKRKSPWALIIIVVVIILFGAFWFVARPKIARIQEQNGLATQNPAPQTLESSNTSSSPEQLESISDLAAAAINTAIPHFSSRL